MGSFFTDDHPSMNNVKVQSPSFNLECRLCSTSLCTWSGSCPLKSFLVVGEYPSQVLLSSLKYFCSAVRKRILFT